MNALHQHWRVLVLALATLLGVMSFSGQARAQAPANAYVALMFAPLVITDTVFTGYDLVKLVQEERLSRGMAIAEIAVAGPQLLLGSVITLDVLLTDRPEGTRTDMPVEGTSYFVVFTLWTAALTAHGIVSLLPASSAPAPKVRPRDPRRRFGLTPTLLRHSGALLPGLAAYGRF